jgi:hypothetical protein
MKTMANRPHNGKSAKELFKISAKLVYYHRDGSFFMVPNLFPAALADPSGYILFKNKESFYGCSQLGVGQRTNARNGISRIAGYMKMI